MTFYKRLLKVYYACLHYYNKLTEPSFKPGDDYKQIPIIINNRNRYTYLLRLVASLEKRGYHNIHIIDNASTYPPLLEYYKTCQHTLHKLDKNAGYLALWQTGLHKQFSHTFYVYTDPDLELVEECPDDFILYMLKVLQSNYKIQKIGLALKYDDLPDHFVHKGSVTEWEKHFYTNKYEDGLYVANVDTTFALYRPKAKGGSHDFKMNIRTSFPYQCRHLPWYEDSNNLPEEEQYYIAHAVTSTFWTKENKI